MIIAADIGGTKLLFGLFEVGVERPELVYKQRYSSRDFSSLEEAIHMFLNGVSAEYRFGTPSARVSALEITSACFSVAGPVVAGVCRMTNLGWVISEDLILERFPMLNQVRIRNDMEAMGKGLALVAPEDIVRLMPGGKMPPSHFPLNADESKKAIGILVPGTGLGEAYMIGDKVMASEGGHCDFGPRDRLQAELWEFLQRETGHVSYERILSGDGFTRLVRFLMDEKGLDRLDFPLVPEEITRRAKDRTDDICVTAVELFAGILGAEAGNLALKTMALGGICLGGNIVREIMPWLQDSCFQEGFVDKGRFSDLMKTIPVYGVLDSDTVLYGSAVLAAEMGR